MIDQEKENLEIRCPRLGSLIPFKYCMISGDDSMPCLKVMDCWWESFDVDAYLKANLPGSVYDMIATSRPKPKVASIVEIAEKAQKKYTE